MFVTNWISTTKIQKISEITNFFRHYFLSRTEVVCRWQVGEDGGGGILEEVTIKSNYQGDKVTIKSNYQEEKVILWLPLI